uniref:Uncharacterized protein n=1 Tax=Candidatus Kentrum sp. TUN TaxID=2126343 RepID=A0A450ZSM8_9GAMM|nr:MAG: hypothetical protein BECKTUN1418F_GA0071002_10953 [Candidatus Kentron sp. TUN]VFK63643.1 MAG: hypothetical protein BECKTUN1418E_GA0071001_109211 [Candidatus Kentron sp. TUN]VFK64021.1 MAG: hypothetical protein BECKTUN1418D_GA0071000_12384 [Candidatus Kentron sp. TUN]
MEIFGSGYARLGIGKTKQGKTSEATPQTLDAWCLIPFCVLPLPCHLDRRERSCGFGILPKAEDPSRSNGMTAQ